MVTDLCAPKPTLVSRLPVTRRRHARTRIEPLAAYLTDLFRERSPGQIVNISASGVGVKANEPFKVNFPVLVECRGLLIIGNVRHCLKASDGGYLLGLEVHRTVDTLGSEIAETHPGLVRRLTCGNRFKTAG